MRSQKDTDKISITESKAALGTAVYDVRRVIDRAGCLVGSSTVFGGWSADFYRLLMKSVAIGKNYEQRRDEILYKNTDEERTMTTEELISSLKERGIEVSRKTLYEVLIELNSFKGSYSKEITMKLQTTNNIFTHSQYEKLINRLK